MGWELPKELVLFLLLSWERWWEAGSDANRVLSVPAHTERTAVTVCPCPGLQKPRWVCTPRAPGPPRPASLFTR